MDKSRFADITIPDVDTKKGLTMSGGTEANYHAVLSLFCKDAEERLNFLHTLAEESLSEFVIQIHALKSASGSIGAAKASALASELEEAGRAENFLLVKEKLPVYVEQLTQLVKNIKPALEKWEAQIQYTSDSAFLNNHFSLFKELMAALESNNGNVISQILQELTELSSQEPIDSESKEAIEEIFDEVMMAEYDNAKKIVAKLIETNHGS